MEEGVREAGLTARSYDLICGRIEHVVTWGLEHRVLGQIDAIGVDEIQYARGQKCPTPVDPIDLFLI